MGRNKIILVDMDGVIADFNLGALLFYKQIYPGEMLPDIDDPSKYFYLEDNYPGEFRNRIQKVYKTPGFFATLPPIDGALEALTDLSSHYNVYICTSPLLENPSCAQDKTDWIAKHLGGTWLKKLIISKDKTLVKGDILIDDKPVIKGINSKPAWQHVLYDQKYNAHIKDKPRLNWSNWESVLKNIL